MRLYYYRDPIGNFGDDLNPWLWPRLLPGLVDDRGDELLVGIGTILNQRIPEAPLKRVFGSGSGYGTRLTSPLNDRWRVYCVRGPLTAQSLGLPPSTAVVDPAVLVRDYTPRAVQPSGIALMLHHKNPAFALWEAVCKDEGIAFINPRHSVDVVLEGLAAARLVLAEAMHGAIVADALRIPWVPLKVSGIILGWKWRDWTQSLELPYEPDSTLWTMWDDPGAVSWRNRAKNSIKMRYNALALRRLARSHGGFLSKESVLLSREQRLRELLSELAQDVNESRNGVRTPQQV